MQKSIEQIKIADKIDKRISEIIREEVGNKIKDFGNCLDYAIFGGKKFRSQLLIASANVFQGDSDKAIDCGCAFAQL